jgi:hypothetical protein
MLSTDCRQCIRTEHIHVANASDSLNVTHRAISQVSTLAILQRQTTELLTKLQAQCLAICDLTLSLSQIEHAHTTK